MKMKTLRGEGTTSEFYGAAGMRASQIGSLGKDHQINRSRLVKALIRKAAYVSHYSETRYEDGKHVNVLTDEKYAENIKNAMIQDFTKNENRRKSILKFMRNVLALRAAYNGRKAEYGAGYYAIYSRRQTVYENEDGHVGVHFRPAQWKAEDGGNGIPKTSYSIYRLEDGDLNNDDWELLAPMMEELLSISGLVTDLTNRGHVKVRLARTKRSLVELVQKFDETDWGAEQKKDDELQAWLESAPSHAKLNVLTHQFRVFRGKAPVVQVIQREEGNIAHTKASIKRAENDLAKNIHLDHLNSESLKASEAAKWNEIVDMLFGIGGEEE